MSRLTKKEKKQIIERLMRVEKPPETYNEAMAQLSKAMKAFGVSVFEAVESFKAFNQVLKSTEEKLRRIS